MRWQDELKKYASIAYETGQKLEFTVNIRGNLRKWKVFLKDLKAQGQNEIDEED